VNGVAAYERMMRKMIYLLVGALVAVGMQLFTFNTLTARGVETTVAFGLSFGVLVVVLAFWIGTLTVIFRGRL